MTVHVAINLGSGLAYFYGEGISDPVEDAKEWAIKAAYDKATGQMRYTKYSVIKALIAPKKLLNGTVDDGLKAINYARNFLVKSAKPTERKDFRDDEIIQFLVARMNFDVVMVNLNIRTQHEISIKFNARLPNVRVICVRDQNALDPSTFEVVHEEIIEHHDI